MRRERTGAHLLIEALVDGGIEICFANPGTSEMHFVAALGDEPRMKPVLCLFEGVVTGAADGYARMARRPAATLLHLGPGLANGLANLHNARKAGTAMVNVIGDHATFHKPYDAPLNSDIEATAAPYSHWVRTSSSIGTLAEDVRDAIATAHCGRIASLILPADLAWTPIDGALGGLWRIPPPRASDAAIDAAAARLTNGRRTGLILGGDALFGEGLRDAGRIAAASGATLLAPYASARIERGHGLPESVRIPFPVDAAVALLAKFDQLLLVGAREPVAFFAYPGKPSRLVPEGAEILPVAGPAEDAGDALKRIAAALGAGASRNDAPVGTQARPAAGPITPESLAAAVAYAIRDGTILVDEGVTSSRGVFDVTVSGPRHDLLVNVGGSIGAGLPLALGAAMACPDRPVLCLSGDGSASYTPQTLWSMARQRANVTVVICANRDYSILKGEMVRVGAMAADAPPHPLLELVDPSIDWVALARAYGVAAASCADAGELSDLLRDAPGAGGPFLIEAVMR